MPERSQDQETLLLLLIAIMAPPFAVFMMRGCGHEVMICVLLCFCFILPGHIYAYYLVAQHHVWKKTGQSGASGYPAQSTKSNVVQVVPATTPPPVVQAIEYKPQPAAPPPPTPVSPTPAAPAPTPAPAPAPAPAATEQVVVVTKSPDKAPEKAPEAPPAVVPVAATK